MHWFGFLVLIGLPLLLSVFSFSKAISWQRDFSDRVLRCSVRVKARVVAVKEEAIMDKQDGSRSTWLHPVVCFFAHGKELRVRCEDRWNPLPFDVGDELVVWYNPDDPRDIHLEGKYCGIGRNHTTPLAISLICGVIAIGCAVFCICYDF